MDPRAPAHHPYRADVDGLRAIAVLPVVLFHASSAHVPGGYVGVDVFFTISGFLIGGIVLREVRAGTFSLAEFYARRFRRIIPALAVVLAATTAVALSALLPAQLATYGRSLAAAAGFVSNLFFWTQSGYFSPVSDWAPLLHTWSLGVEEQYYLVLPLILMALARRRGFVAFSVAVCAGGLVLAEHGAREYPAAAFFLFPFRLWELFLGVWLAATLDRWRPGRAGRDALAVGGLAAILAGVALYDGTTRFPGLAALPPCLGTAMVIAAGAHGDHALSGLLRSRPLVHVGLVSYSLYLWHWPVLVFLRLRGAAVELPGEVAAAGVLLSFALAELSYRLVERPLRVPGRIGRGQAFAGTAAVVAVCLAAGAALDLSGGLPARVPASALRLAAAADDVDPQRRTCRDLRAGTPEHAARCTFGAPDRPVTYALVGDSHAASVRAGLEAALPGRRGVLHWDSGCAMLPGTALSGRSRGDVCERFREEALLAVERDPGIELVVLAGRWAYWLEGTRPEVSGSLTSALVDLAEPGADPRREAIFARALGRAVARLRAAGKRVVILGPTPEYGIDLPTVRALASWRGAGAPLSVTREAFERRNARALPALAAVAAAHGATLVRVEGALCDEAGCPSGTADRVFYYDTNHLTLTAARERLGPHLAAALATVTSTGASR